MRPDPKPAPRTRRNPESRSSMKQRRDPAWRDARAAWRQHSVRFGCVVCPARGDVCDGPMHSHHWLYEQHIRNWISAHAQENDLTPAERQTLEVDLIWNFANGGGACERAHRRHHNRVEPIAMDLVPLAAVAFAARLGLGYRLEEAYP